MLYSKDGSFPAPETDGTEGWIEVNEPPAADEGYETVWWYPPGWVVRPIQPAAEDGFIWKWNQTDETWVRYPLPEPTQTEDPVIDPEALVTSDSSYL